MNSKEERMGVTVQTVKRGTTDPYSLTNSSQITNCKATCYNRGIPFEEVMPKIWS